MTDTKIKNIQDNKISEHAVDSENDPFDYGPLGSDEPVELADGYVKTLNGEATPKVLTLPSLPTADCEHSLTNVDDPDPLPQWRSSPQVGCWRQHNGVPTDIVLYHRGYEYDKVDWPTSITGDGTGYNVDIQPGVIMDSSADDGTDGTQDRVMIRGGDGLTTIDHSGSGDGWRDYANTNTPVDLVPHDRNPNECTHESNEHCFCDRPMTYKTATTIDKDEVWESEFNTSFRTRNTPHMVDLRKHHHETYRELDYKNSKIRVGPKDASRNEYRSRWNHDKEAVDAAIRITFEKFWSWTDEIDTEDYPINPWSERAIKSQYDILDTTTGSLRNKKPEEIVIVLCALYAIDDAYNHTENVSDPAERVKIVQYAQDCAEHNMHQWNKVRLNADGEHTELLYGHMVGMTKEIMSQLDCYSEARISPQNLWNEFKT